jgi:hypothetical protein
MTTLPTAERTTHTAGPWGFHPNYNRINVLKVLGDGDGIGPFTSYTAHISSGDRMVATVMGWTLDRVAGGYPRQSTPEEVEADARLIIQSPELLAQLKAVRDLYYAALNGDFAKTFIGNVDMVAIEEAINAAEGSI